MIRAWLFFALLSGCALPDPGGDAPVPPADCGAARLADRLGTAFATLPAAALPPTRRVIRPGDAVTEDYSAARLNIYLDAQDLITALTCG